MERLVRVPVEHRWLGLDRRTFGYALAALLVYAMWAGVMPWLNARIPWRDPIVAGDVIQVTPAVTMVPAVGWNLVSGLRTTDTTVKGEKSTTKVTLIGNGLQLVATPGTFSGTPADLLDRVDDIATATGRKDGLGMVGDARPISTGSGLDGLVRGLRADRYVGVLAVFVADQGIEIEVIGPADQMTAESDDIYTMINSLTYARVSR